jgi:hypothetical protein
MSSRDSHAAQATSDVPVQVFVVIFFSVAVYVPFRV